MKLSPDDRREIEDLYARYAYAFDSGDAEEWAALFTPDGAFGRQGEEPIVGTRALQEFVASSRSTTPGVTHHTTNILLEPTVDGARGRAYVIALRTPGDSVLLRNVGIYEDELVRHRGRWCFSTRRFASLLPPEAIDAPLLAGGPAEPGSRSEWNRQVVLRYFSCIDREDWDGLAAILDEEIELRAVGARPRYGREAALDYFRRALSIWERHTDRPVRLIEDGDAIAAEIEFRGVTGDSRELEWEAVDVFHLRNGRIRRLASFYDLDWVRGRLGS